MNLMDLFNTIISFPKKLAGNWPKERPQQALFILGIVLGGVAIFGLALPTISALTTTALFLTAFFMTSMYFLERAICGKKSLLGDISATSQELNSNSAESLFSLIPRKISDFMSNRVEFFKKLQLDDQVNFEGFTAATTAGQIFEFADRLLSGLIYGLCVVGMASMVTSAIASAGMQFLSVALLGGLSLYLIECAQNPGTASLDWGDISSILMFKKMPHEALKSIFSRRCDFAMRSIDALADLFGISNPVPVESQKKTQQPENNSPSIDPDKSKETKPSGTEKVNKLPHSLNFSSQNSTQTKTVDNKPK